VPESQPVDGRVERRLSPRRPARLGVTVYGSGAPDPGHCLDVGGGGVCLETPHRLEIGVAATLVLPIPGGDAVMVVAEVLDAHENGGGWVSRLAFRDLRRRDRERLDAFVSETVRSRRGEG